MTYFIKLSNGYSERLRSIGDDWYVWEAKPPKGTWGNGFGIMSYAGHESTFTPSLTATDKIWALSNK